MAKLCGLSASHFHKVFVETMGTTPNRYLILTRLSAAKTMLLAGNQSVAHVAERCGFSSQAYFCQCLKKFTGMSPKQLCRLADQLDEA
jgi:AraC-like DNA-binding protein